MEVSHRETLCPAGGCYGAFFPLKSVVLVLSLLGGLMLVSFLGASLLKVNNRS